MLVFSVTYTTMEVFVPQISLLLDRDPCMKEHEEEVRRRYGNYQDCLVRMGQEGGLEQFAMGYKKFGPQVYSLATAG